MVRVRVRVGLGFGSWGKAGQAEAGQLGQGRWLGFRGTPRGTCRAAVVAIPPSLWTPGPKPDPERCNALGLKASGRLHADGAWLRADAAC